MTEGKATNILVDKAPVDATEPLVCARNVHKSFGSNAVLKGIDLDVRPGEVVVILGPSGSGKSTFLRCINHLEAIDRGSIMVAGAQVGYAFRNERLVKLSERAIAVQRRQIGMVFQQFNLYPHMTALENIIEAPIGVHGQPRAEAVRYAMELLARIGLSEKANAYPRQLSGGQQQRVAIARALAIRPRLMLFDEPTSALDPELVGEVLATMRDLAGQGLTMIVVTHEIGFAREAADRVVFMDGGLIVEQGPPGAILANPQHPRTRLFLSRFISHVA
jgi:polar amino acid transport system ATP-binding protein